MFLFELALSGLLPSLSKIEGFPLETVLLTGDLSLDLDSFSKVILLCLGFKPSEKFNYNPLNKSKGTHLQTQFGVVLCW